MTNNRCAWMDEIVRLANACESVALYDVAEMLRNARTSAEASHAAQATRQAAQGAHSTLDMLCKAGAVSAQVGQVRVVLCDLMVITGHSLTVEALALDALCIEIDRACAGGASPQPAAGWGEPGDDDAAAPLPVLVPPQGGPIQVMSLEDLGLGPFSETLLVRTDETRIAEVAR